MLNRDRGFDIISSGKCEIVTRLLNITVVHVRGEALATSDSTIPFAKCYDIRPIYEKFASHDPQFIQIIFHGTSKIHQHTYRPRYCSVS